MNLPYNKQPSILLPCMHVGTCVNYEKATNSHIIKSWWNSNSMKNQILRNDGLVAVAKGEKLAPAELLHLVMRDNLEQRL